MARHSSTRHLLRLPWQLQSLEDRSQPSMVRVSPSLLNLPPTANDFTSDTDGTNPVTLDLLSKASPVGDHTLVPSSILVIVPPQHGTISINPTTGNATYTATGFSQGTDSFQFTVRDSAGVVSNPATITVVVHRPTANDDFAQIVSGSTAIIDALANDTDPEGNSEIVPSKVRLLTLPLHGTVSINSTNGSVTYKPERTFAGTETLQYTITDRAGAESAPGHITIVVSPIAVIPKAAPVANDDAADTDGTNPVEVDVLGNDMAAAGLTLDPASIRIAAAPARGTVAVNATTGVVTYTASGFFTGTDTFAYTANDSKGVVSNVASVTIVINRPTANDDFADTDGNNSVVLDVLANDTDPDGNEKIEKSSVTILSTPTHGRTSIDAATGKITYTAIVSCNYSGTLRVVL